MRTKGTPCSIVFLVLLSLSASELGAVDPSRPIHESMQTVYTSRDGLPGESMNEVFQDSRGYLWIGSFNGVVRYDGARFRVFPQGMGLELQVRSADVIAEADDGAVWIGTNGDGLVRFTGEKATPITQREGLPSDVVRTMVADGSGGVFAGTIAGLARVDRDGKVSIPFPNLLGPVHVEMVFFDRAGNLWVSTRSGSLFRMARRGADPPEEVRLPGVSSVLVMLEDGRGRLWFGTRGGGLFVSEGKNVSDESARVGFSGRAVNTLCEDRHGALWIGSDAGVARLFEGRVDRFDAKNGLVDEQVNRLREDHEGNVWIATSRGGVTRLSEGKAIALTTRQGLVNDTVNAVVEDREGTFWIATDRGLSVFRDKAFVDHPLARAVASLRVRHAMEDRSGRIWLSTYPDRGVFVWDHGTIRTISTADGLTGNRCRMAVEDSSGAVWIATTNGLNRLKDGRIETFTTRSGLADDYVLGVFEDSRKDLWVATNGGGLNRFRGGRVERFGKGEGLASNVVFGVFEDSRHEIWATTNAGVSLLRGERFVSFTPREGLLGNAVFQMLEDASGLFWMRADIGVFTARADEMRRLEDGKPRFVPVRLLDSRDGLLGAPTPISWAFQTAGGELWSPTLRGVAILDTKRFPANRVAPRVYVEDVVVDGAVQPARSFTTLGPRYKRVTFRYAGLSFQVPERVRFCVMLEGFDSAWSEPVPGREATYTTLPPGKYTFKVRAANNDGLWSEEVASVSFRQPPLFRQSAAFFLLVAVAFSGATAGLVAFRHRQLRRRQDELERLVALRTEEIRRSSQLLEEQKRELEESQLLVRKANESLEQLARTDALTGLGNRRQAEECLEREWSRHRREGAPLGMLMVDVDGFKAFNDCYGHQAGDECLRRVAAVLADSVRGLVDQPARYGGEEFLLVLPGAALEGALGAAERVRDGVERQAIPHQGSPCSTVLTVSVGAASVLPSDAASPESLIRAADAALYLAKQAGRNKVSAPPAPELAGS